MGRANALPTQDQESRSTEWYVRNLYLIAEAAELRTEDGDELWAKGRLGFGRVVERIDCYRWGLVSGLVGLATPPYSLIFPRQRRGCSRLTTQRNIVGVWFRLGGLQKTHGLKMGVWSWLNAETALNSPLR